MLNEPLRRYLLDTAEAAIRNGLAHGRPPAPMTKEAPAPLHEPGASFVTLTRNGELRGCIGTLEAVRPLLADVAQNAYAAAFEDPRFPPLTEEELPGLTLQISLLSAPRPLHFRSEEELLMQLRPGIDGLILQDRGRRGTFLPTVWESLPDRKEFLAHLKMKAGLPPDWWSDTLQVERYTTESFSTRL